MERRRQAQAQTPVTINALLIGEKTVPKGCRVTNVSQNGMQLQCHADGRLLTFKDGDSVDVHLTIQHDGKQKKLTIPSWVRHVAANTIDVEFHKPDPPLVDLIESYRLSEEHKLEASLGRKDRRIAGNRTGAASRGAIDTDRPVAVPTDVQPNKQGNKPFYAVILATLFAVCVITGGYVYTASIDSRIGALETLGKRHSTELAEMQNRVFSASLQEGRYASLNARMSALVDAILGIEDRLGPAGAASVSTPLRDRLQAADSPFKTQPPAVTLAQQPGRTVPAGGTAKTDRSPDSSVPVVVAVTDAEPRRMADEARTASLTGPVSGPSDRNEARGAKVSARQDAAPASGAGPAPRTPASGTAAPASSENSTPGPAQASAPNRDAPWVINLISSTDKAYVERFSRDSGAARFNAELNSATVNGRQYWRLQITGFESAAEAKKQASDVKQALGISDVWIFRQK